MKSNSSKNIMRCEHISERITSEENHVHNTVGSKHSQSGSNNDDMTQTISDES